MTACGIVFVYSYICAIIQRCIINGLVCLFFAKERYHVTSNCILIKISIFCMINLKLYTSILKIYIHAEVHVNVAVHYLICETSSP